MFQWLQRFLNFVTVFVTGKLLVMCVLYYYYIYYYNNIYIYIRGFRILIIFNIYYFTFCMMSIYFAVVFVLMRKTLKIKVLIRTEKITVTKRFLFQSGKKLHKQ